MGELPLEVVGQEFGRAVGRGLPEVLPPHAEGLSSLVDDALLDGLIPRQNDVREDPLPPQDKVVLRYVLSSDDDGVVNEEARLLRFSGRVYVNYHLLITKFLFSLKIHLKKKTEFLFSLKIYLQKT